MPTPSPAIIQILHVFAPAFTAPTFANALVLLYGTILTVGRRTVAAALRAVGIVLVGDGGYAAVPLGHTCRQLPGAVRLVSRLRLDATLYDPPAPAPPSKRGPKPKKGARQPALAARLADPTTSWQTLALPWYGGQEKTLAVATGTALWHRAGEPPLPLRWVLLHDPHGRFPPTALFCTDPDALPTQVVAWFVGRWNIEVTFEEVRAHLGVETQRQWSTRAIGWTTPCLLGLFSLVVLLALALHPQDLPTRAAAWYRKPEATFAEVLAAVRRHLWASWNCAVSHADADTTPIPHPLWQSLHEAICYAA